LQMVIVIVHGLSDGADIRRRIRGRRRQKYQQDCDQSGNQRRCLHQLTISQLDAKKVAPGRRRTYPSKRKRPRLIESWDARRTALPRSLLTDSLTSLRERWNGPNGLLASHVGASAPLVRELLLANVEPVGVGCPAERSTTVVLPVRTCSVRLDWTAEGCSCVASGSCRASAGARAHIQS